MAIQPMALQVQNTQGNALGAFAQGQQHAQQTRSNELAIAEQTMRNIGQLAFGVMGGKLDGTPDPALWEEALDMIGGMGVPVDQFRGRPDLAPVIARSSADILGQLSQGLNEQQLAQRMREFDFQVSEALKGPAPTADQQNFAAAQADPAFAEFLAADNAPNPPANVGEYNFYAEQEKAAGREPLSFLDFQNAQKGNGVTMTMPDGTAVQVGGQAKPLTEGQSKDTVYVTRATGALPLIDQYGSELMNPVARAVEGDQTGIARGAFQSPEFQQAQQAGKEFLQAILRKDTGAAITPQEQSEYGSVYLPVPGDSPEVLAQKKQSRARAVEAIKAGLPPQAILSAEMALQASGSTAPSNPVTPPPAAGELARPMTQADYDAIPSGGLFIDPDDGQTYRKP